MRTTFAILASQVTAALAVPASADNKGRAIHLPARKRRYEGAHPRELVRASSASALQDAVASHDRRSGVKRQSEATTTSYYPPTITSVKAEDVPLYTSISSQFGSFFEVLLNVEGTNLTVLADFGSGDFLVPASDCQACKDVGMVLTTVPGNTSDAGVPGQCNISLPYTVGNITSCNRNMTITLGTDTVANYSGYAFYDIPSGQMPLGPEFSGIMGFTTSGLDPVNFPLAMYYQGVISEPVVGVYLGSNGNGTNAEITLGDVSLSSYVDTATYVTLANSNASQFLSQHYSANLTGLFVDTKNVTSLNTSLPVWLDSGSDAVYLPLDIAYQLEQLIYGDAGVWNASGGAWTVPCDFVGPNNTVFQFDNIADVSVSPNNSAWVMNSGPPAANGTCMGSIVGGDIDFDYDPPVIGTPLFESVYAAYNVENLNVTFYPLKQN